MVAASFLLTSTHSEICHFVSNIKDLYFSEEMFCIVGNSLHRTVCTETNTSYILTKYNRLVTFWRTLFCEYMMCSDLILNCELITCKLALQDKLTTITKINCFKRLAVYHYLHL